MLTAEGFDVVAPSSQGCCGALSAHAGRIDEARQFARRLIDTFEESGSEAVVVNSAGCGSAMKHYGHLLKSDTIYATRAEQFSSRVVDVMEFLANIDPVAPRHPLDLRLAYHDACHLCHGQGIRAEPRAVLGEIPGLEVVDLSDKEACCGSAGIYNLVEPATALQLGAKKADARCSQPVHRLRSPAIQAATCRSPQRFAPVARRFRSRTASRYSRPQSPTGGARRCSRSHRRGPLALHLRCADSSAKVVRGGKARECGVANSLTPRRWFPTHQPQTLQIACALLYWNAALTLLAVLSSSGYRMAFFGILIVDVVGAYGIANSRKVGYAIGVVAAALPLLLLIYAGLGAFSILTLLFDLALFFLLVHPMSRQYVRVWFR